MTEEVQMTKDMAKESMESSLSHLATELTKIRAGKANPAMLDGIYFDYYGSQTPLNQASNINTLDGETISVQPWEKAEYRSVSSRTRWSWYLQAGLSDIRCYRTEEADLRLQAET